MSKSTMRLLLIKFTSITTINSENASHLKEYITILC